MNKTILITGCSGQLGYRLYSDLSNYFNVIDTYKQHENKGKKLDLTSKEDFNYIFSNYNPDIIINCAALTDVDYCEENKSHCHAVNVEGLNKIISFSNIDTKIIHISSDYVFDGAKGEYDEKQATYPINYYGKSKLESENILIGSNRRHTIFRLSTLFDNSNKNFFTWVLNSLKNNQEIIVAEDMISTPTWIPSFSNAIIKSVHLDLSGLFHYGSDNPISRFDFAKLIANKFSLNKNLLIARSLNEINFAAKRPKNTSLISKALSHQIEVDLDDIDYVLKILNDTL